MKRSGGLKGFGKDSKKQKKHKKKVLPVSIKLDVGLKLDVGEPKPEQKKPRRRRRYTIDDDVGGVQGGSGMLVMKKKATGKHKMGHDISKEEERAAQLMMEEKSRKYEAMMRGEGQDGQDFIGGLVDFERKVGYFGDDRPDDHDVDDQEERRLREDAAMGAPRVDRYGRHLDELSQVLADEKRAAEHEQRQFRQY